MPSQQGPETSASSGHRTSLAAGYPATDCQHVSVTASHQGLPLASRGAEEESPVRTPTFGSSRGSSVERDFKEEPSKEQALSAKSPVLGAGEQDAAHATAASLKNARASEHSVDLLLHWWCRQHLEECLRKLMHHTCGPFFSEPVPWEELGLRDYPEVVPEPMDLNAIGDILDCGDYDDEEGFINPDFFWEDVELCWENCIRFYENDQEVEAFGMAHEMRAFGKELEAEFWAGMGAYEQSLQHVDPALSSLVVAADRAANVVQEAAGDFSHMLKRMLSGWTEASEGLAETAPAPDGNRPRLLRRGSRNSRPDMMEHFREILEEFYQDLDLEVVCKDLKDIQEELDRSFKAEWSGDRQAVFREEDAEDETQALAFPGVDQKLPLHKCLPAGHRSSGLRRQNSRQLQRTSSPSSRGSKTSAVSRRSWPSGGPASGPPSRPHSPAGDPSHADSGSVPSAPGSGRATGSHDGVIGADESFDGTSVARPPLNREGLLRAFAPKARSAERQ